MKVSEHRDAGRVRRANNSLRAALLRLAARRFDSISACIKRTSGKVPRTALTRRRADLQATASYDCTADRGQRVCWHLARAADDVPPHGGNASVDSARHFAQTTTSNEK